MCYAMCVLVWPIVVAVIEVRRRRSVWGSHVIASREARRTQNLSVLFRRLRGHYNPVRNQPGGELNSLLRRRDSGRDRYHGAPARPKLPIIEVQR